MSLLREENKAEKQEVEVGARDEGEKEFTNTRSSVPVSSVLIVCAAQWSMYVFFYNVELRGKLLSSFCTPALHVCATLCTSTLHRRLQCE